jgi:hypothetical protein
MVNGMNGGVLPLVKLLIRGSENWSLSWGP